MESTQARQAILVELLPHLSTYWGHFGLGVFQSWDGPPPILIGGKSVSMISPIFSPMLFERGERSWNYFFNSQSTSWDLLTVLPTSPAPL